ncbi:PLP-dependent aminotransferase family protein [Fructilactobacillus frigidiflavus]|uniref:aminotransferase-like domain-containing protein n=1 Tax=Fructilactobacillus frigidiflavus TaxID=3242688 RepID=UPI0037573125
MKYETVKQLIKTKIKREHLKSGDKLPSIRSLESQTGFSKATIIKALTELEQAHLIYAIPQRGYFVTGKPKAQPQHAVKFNFLAANPEATLFDFKQVHHCLDQVFQNFQSEILSYGYADGLRSLRKQILHLLGDQQIFASVDRTFITSGAQQALNIMLNVPFPNQRQNILIEQPTYAGLYKAAQITGNRVFGIDITQRHFNLKQLEAIFRNNEIKFFYVMPSFQNPTGHHYSTAEKRQILALAEQYDVYIVEDDFLGDLGTINEPNSFFALDEHQRVIYLKSFSKIFLPSLRLAGVILPRNLVDNFLEYKKIYDLSSSNISQEILATFIENGMFALHLKKLRTHYQLKMKELLRCCELYLPADVKFFKPTSGFYTCLELPSQINSTKLTQQLAQQDILVQDVAGMFLSYYQNHTLIRLSIAEIPLANIEPGIKRISEVIRNDHQQQNSIFSDQFFI